MAMFDFREHYMRVAQNLPHNCKVVEIGVADGESALFLAKCLDGLEKKYTLYMVDSLDYGGVNQLCKIYENIIASGLGKNIKVIPKDSIEASKDFNDNSLDFVFLDSSHQYEPTKFEIKNWYNKLKDGCYLSGHDYTSVENPGVRKAVDEMIPKVITRPPIDKPDQKQTFDPEIHLQTIDTEEHNGVWIVEKKFYWEPKL